MKSYLCLANYELTDSFKWSVHISAKIVLRPTLQALYRSSKKVIRHNPCARPDTPGDLLHRLAWRLRNLPLHHRDILRSQALFPQPFCNLGANNRARPFDIASKFADDSSPCLSNRPCINIDKLVPAMEKCSART